jgi:predicted transcriptional regulator
VIKYILPAIRSLIAKELIERYGYSQMIVAEKLGTTQAAISHYLRSKRGEERMEQLERIPIIRATVGEIAKGLAEGEMKGSEAMNCFCDLCKILRTQNLICDIHKDFMNLPPTCDLCLPRKITT